MFLFLSTTPYSTGLLLTRSVVRRENAQASIDERRVESLFFSLTGS